MIHPMSRLQERIERIFASWATGSATRPAEGEAHVLARGWMVEAGLEVEGRRRREPDRTRPRRRARGLGPWAASRLGAVRRALRRRARRPRRARGGRASRPSGAGGRRVPGRGARVRGQPCPGRVGLGAGGVPRAPHRAGAASGAPRTCHSAAVTGIVGYSRQTVTVTGRAGHAGTTPMEGQRTRSSPRRSGSSPSGQAAAAIHEAVATVGTIKRRPGGATAIPGGGLVHGRRACARPRTPRRAARRDRPRDRRRRRAGRRWIRPWWPRPAPGQAIQAAGVALPQLASGAGHDAGILASAGVAARNALRPESATAASATTPTSCSHPDDCALAVDVLADALARLLHWNLTYPARKRESNRLLLVAFQRGKRRVLASSACVGHGACWSSPPRRVRSLPRLPRPLRRRRPTRCAAAAREGTRTGRNGAVASRRPHWAARDLALGANARRGVWPCAVALLREGADRPVRAEEGGARGPPPEAVGLVELVGSGGTGPPVVRFEACAEGVRAFPGAYRGTVGRYTGFPFGFRLARRAVCVPLRVWVDGRENAVPPPRAVRPALVPVARGRRERDKATDCHLSAFAPYSVPRLPRIG